MTIFQVLAFLPIIMAAILNSALRVRSRVNFLADKQNMIEWTITNPKNTTLKNPQGGLGVGSWTIYKSA